MEVGVGLGDDVLVLSGVGYTMTIVGSGTKVAEGVTGIVSTIVEGRGVGVAVP